MSCSAQRQPDPGAGRRLVGLLAALLLALVPMARAAASAQLQRLALEPDGSALTFHMQGSVKPRTFLLDQPRRFVIDLPATRKGARATVPDARGAVESLRVAAQKDGSLRVVIGLADGARASLAPIGKNASLLTVRLDGGGGQRPPSRAPLTPAPTGTSSPARNTPVIAAHAPPPAGRDVVVAIDAGHGGEDPGASGQQGTQEKVITLAIARRLAERLQRESGVRAILTRDRDQFVPLRERAERARRAGADLFVSIHADAVRDRDVEGASVYVLSERGASSEAAHILAARENAADLRGVPLSGRPDSLASVLVDLSQSAALGSSVEAAGNVLDALDEVGAIRKREVQYAGFAVLKSPDMPSMLVETAYISNPSEESKLRSAAYQTRLAEAIGGGVLKYLRLHPPDGTRLALERRGAEAHASQLARNP